MTSRAGALAAIAIAAAWLAAAQAPEAHKTVVSKFTYNRDVFPILQRHCGSCHVDGGVAPTLLTYDAASSFPWGLQQALLSRRMPPWSADDGLMPVKGQRSLSFREFDTLMTWAAGGTPEGTPLATPNAPASTPAWSMGTPDLVVAMPEPVTLTADRLTLEHEVTLPLTAAAGKWIRAVDVRPGNPAIVRRAALSLRSGAGPDAIVGLWIPGDAPQTFEAGAAFLVPKDAALVMRLHYQRPAAAKSASVEDRSTAAIYFGNPASSKPLRTIVIGDDADTPPGASRVISQAIDREATLVAVRPISGPPDATARIVIVDAAGVRTPVMRLQLRDEWPRRYVLQSPIRLRRGSSVELGLTGSHAAIWETLTGDRPAGPADGGPLRIAIETVTP